MNKIAKLVPTWWKLYGALDTQTLVAFNGGTPLFRVDTRSALEIREVTQAYEASARNFERASDTEEAPKVPTWGEWNKEMTVPNFFGALHGLDVFLEAGHGWSGQNFDPGAVGRVKEWEQNKEQAQSCADALWAMGANVRLELYNKGTGYRSLSQRGSMCAPCHIFVSFHNNAFGKSSVQGTETLIDRLADKEDEALARMVQKELVGATKFIDRGVKRQGLGVLRGAKHGSFAACLTEAYFVTADGLSNVQSLNNDIGKAVANAIKDFALQNKQSIKW